MIPDKIYYSYINVKNGEEKCIEIPITADDVYKNTDTILIGINNRHRSMIYPGSKKFRLNLSSHLNIVFHRFYIYGIYTTEKNPKQKYTI